MALCYSRPVGAGLVISASLSTSPWRPDYIFIPLVPFAALASQRAPGVLPGSRQPGRLSGCTGSTSAPGHDPPCGSGQCTSPGLRDHLSRIRGTGRPGWPGADRTVPGSVRTCGASAAVHMPSGQCAGQRGRRRRPHDQVSAPHREPEPGTCSSGGPLPGTCSWQFPVPPGIPSRTGALGRCAPPECEPCRFRTRRPAAEAGTGKGFWPFPGSAYGGAGSGNPYRRSCPACGAG